MGSVVGPAHDVEFAFLQRSQLILPQLTWNSAPLSCNNFLLIRCSLVRSYSLPLRSCCCLRRSCWPPLRSCCPPLRSCCPPLRSWCPPRRSCSCLLRSCCPLRNCSPLEELLSSELLLCSEELLSSEKLLSSWGAAVIWGAAVFFWGTTLFFWGTTFFFWGAHFSSINLIVIILKGQIPLELINISVCFFNSLNFVLRYFNFDDILSLFSQLLHSPIAESGAIVIVVYYVLCGVVGAKLGEVRGCKKKGPTQMLTFTVLSRLYVVCVHMWTFHWDACFQYYLESEKHHVLCICVDHWLSSIFAQLLLFRW